MADRRVEGGHLGNSGLQIAGMMRALIAMIYLALPMR
jgi:hypothetical protein